MKILRIGNLEVLFFSDILIHLLVSGGYAPKPLELHNYYFVKNLEILSKNSRKSLKNLQNLNYNLYKLQKFPNF